jgi:hypothetical protein
MSFRLASRQFYLGAAASCLGAWLAFSAHAAGGSRGRPIKEFPVPKSDEVTTNLHQLTSKADGLKQLEEDLYQPLQSLAPKSSLDGVVVRPPRPSAGPVIQNKRVKELLERRKDWVFMTPEDLLAPPTVEEILKAPQLDFEGQEQKDSPAMERFYRRLAAKRPEANTPLPGDSKDAGGGPAESLPGDESALREEMNLPSGVRESAEALHQLLDLANSDSPFVREATHGDFADTFGLNGTPPSPQQVREHKKFMDEYRSLADPNWHPSPEATPGNPLAIVAETGSQPGNQPPGTPGVRNPTLRNILEVEYDVKYPRLGPPALPDINAQANGQTRPTPPPPKVEATRILPPAPTFEVPTRSFR